MPHDVLWHVSVKPYRGSSADDIQDEPDWTRSHEHRVGVRNRQDRFLGFTHEEDEDEVHELTTSTSASATEKEFEKEAKEVFDSLCDGAKKGDLVNFRDIIQAEKDLHLRHPANRSIGWRYVLEATED